MFDRVPERLASLLLLVFMVLSPLLAIAQDRNQSPRPPIEGAELYSWRDALFGTWRFSLLPVTSRDKALAEIKDPKRVISDVVLLKAHLAGLSEGAEVYWFWGSQYPELSYPHDAVVADIVKFAAAGKVKVLVSNH